jgi:hypothetical protein
VDYLLVNHRGTYSAKDVLTNGMIGVEGLYYYHPKTKRFYHSKKKIEDQARAKYSDANMI